MEHVREIAADIKRELENPIISRTESETISWIESRITWHMDDAFKIIRNIDSTSLDKMDRARRLIDLEYKYGVPKTHLILKG